MLRRSIRGIVNEEKFQQLLRAQATQPRPLFAQLDQAEAPNADFGTAEAARLKNLKKEAVGG